MGALQHALFELLSRLAVQCQAFDEVSAALHQQAEPEQQSKQGGSADGDHGAHRSLDQVDRRKDAHRPTGLLEFTALDQPGIDVQGQVARLQSWVGLVGGDLLALVRFQRAGGAKPPLRLRGQNDHAEVVGHQ